MISSTDSPEDIDPREVEDASDETPVADIAPELPPRAKNLTEWDNPQNGGAAVKLPMEDEVTPAEELVNEGLDEADRNQRMAAADPDMEP